MSVTLAERGSVSSRARRILVVEDNDDARETLRCLLELEGHEVHEASDGASAVERALRLQPDVALVDIGLPGFDGYEVAQRVRSSSMGRKIRMVAVTGYGQAEDYRRTADAGFEAHLVKPVDPERLAEILDTD